MATKNISEKIIEDFVIILIISLINIFENDSNESILYFLLCVTNTRLYFHENLII